MRRLSVIVIAAGLLAGCTPVAVVSTVADVAVGTVTTAGSLVVKGVSAGVDVVVPDDEDD